MLLYAKTNKAESIAFLFSWRSPRKSVQNRFNRLILVVGPETVTFNNCHILVVEDQPVNQKLALLQLKELGCSVVTVSNGMEAIKAFAVRTTR
jgi:hypothetical protein